jgi:hypothetical protein
MIDLSGSIGSDGVTTQDVRQSVFLDVLYVSITGGTTALTEGGDPLQGITVREVVFGFPIPECVIGAVYDLGPEAATFSPPITITLSYDLGFAGVVDEEALAIAYHDGPGWVALPSTVDAVNDTVTADVDHLSYFIAVYNTAKAGCAPL